VISVKTNLKKFIYFGSKQKQNIFWFVKNVRKVFL